MNSSVLKDIAELKKAVMRRKDGKAVIDALDVKQYIAPVYFPLHDDIEAAAHQYYNLPGGRGSGKSSFCGIEIVNGIMKDETGLSNAIVFRRTANTMRESVFSQIAWAIDVLGVGAYWQGNVSPMCWTYKPTGAQIIFRGLDDSSKLKSIKPRRGYFRFVWLEEFSELPGENFTRSVLQSVIRGGSKFTVLRSFNPPISANNWANMLIQRPDDRAITLHTSYLDVPGEWLGDDFLLEAERLKEINPTAYDNEYLGLACGSGGEVFPNITVRAITDDEIAAQQYIYEGIDFGFSTDPAAFIRAAYDRKHDTIYLIDEIYKKRFSNKQLAEAIKEKKYDRSDATYYSPLFGTTHEERQLITADSAEPKSIADLQGEGLKCIACQKYPGSVRYGVKWLQNRRLVIDPARTPNAHREFIGYEYVQTRDGEITSDLPDRDNHTIDALRYAFDSLINTRKVPA